VRFSNSCEPAGNRTLNPQLKRLLLCQLSYRPSVSQAAYRLAKTCVSLPQFDKDCQGYSNKKKVAKPKLSSAYCFLPSAFCVLCSVFCTLYSVFSPLHCIMLCVSSSVFFAPNFAQCFRYFVLSLP
jgi:hypothetical protein